MAIATTLNGLHQTATFITGAIDKTFSPQGVMSKFLKIVDLCTKIWEKYFESIHQAFDTMSPIIKGTLDFTGCLSAITSINQWAQYCIGSGELKGKITNEKDGSINQAGLINSVCSTAASVLDAAKYASKLSLIELGCNVTLATNYIIPLACVASCAKIWDTCYNSEPAERKAVAKARAAAMAEDTEDREARVTAAVTAARRKITILNELTISSEAAKIGSLAGASFYALSVGSAAFTCWPVLTLSLISASLGYGKDLYDKVG